MTINIQNNVNSENELIYMGEKKNPSYRIIYGYGCTTKLKRRKLKKRTNGIRTDAEVKIGFISSI